MFADEARFGRLSRPCRCWAPPGVRPRVALAVVREYTYAYAAVSPADGTVDWRIEPQLNGDGVLAFLQQLRAAHPDEYVVLVWDGAGAHKDERLPTVANLHPLVLPPYSPELNPVELLWHLVRQRHFANRLFDDLAAVTQEVTGALTEVATTPAVVRRLCGWDWIIAAS